MRAKRAAGRCGVHTKDVFVASAGCEQDQGRWFDGAFLLQEAERRDRLRLSLVPQKKELNERSGGKRSPAPQDMIRPVFARSIASANSVTGYSSAKARFSGRLASSLAKGRPMMSKVYDARLSGGNPRVNGSCDRRVRFSCSSTAASRRNKRRGWLPSSVHVNTMAVDAPRSAAPGSGNVTRSHSFEEPLRFLAIKTEQWRTQSFREFNNLKVSDPSGACFNSRDCEAVDVPTLALATRREFCLRQSDLIAEPSDIFAN